MRQGNEVNVRARTLGIKLNPNHYADRGQGRGESTRRGLLGLWTAISTLSPERISSRNIRIRPGVFINSISASSNASSNLRYRSVSRCASPTPPIKALLLNTCAQGCEATPMLLTVAHVNFA